MSNTVWIVFWEDYGTRGVVGVFADYEKAKRVWLENKEKHKDQPTIYSFDPFKVQ